MLWGPVFLPPALCTLVLVSSFPRSCCCWTLGTVAVDCLRTERHTLVLVIDVVALWLSVKPALLAGSIKRSLPPYILVQPVIKTLLRDGT